jgi:hypothetical protein
MSLGSLVRTMLFGMSIAAATVSLALVSNWAAAEYGPLFRDGVWAAAFWTAAGFGRPALVACWSWTLDDPTDA